MNTTTPPRDPAPDPPAPFSWPRTLTYALLIAPPLGYLAHRWPELEGRIPMHWNIHGEADRYGDRTELLWLLVAILLLPHVLMVGTRLIDPRRGNIRASRRAWQAIRLSLSLLMCALAFLLVHSAAGHGPQASALVMPCLFLFLAAMGNFLPALRSNYFVGIRTPWTIDSEDNWRATHRFAARLWFWGGALGAVLSLLVFRASPFMPSILLVLALALAPVIYSFVYARRHPSR